MPRLFLILVTITLFIGALSAIHVQVRLSSTNETTKIESLREEHEVEEKHSVWRRSPRRTVVVLKKRRRKKIVTCCGHRRCLPTTKYKNSPADPGRKPTVKGKSPGGTTASGAKGPGAVEEPGAGGPAGGGGSQPGGGGESAPGGEDATTAAGAPGDAAKLGDPDAPTEPAGSATDPAAPGDPSSQPGASTDPAAPGPGGSDPTTPPANGANPTVPGAGPNSTTLPGNPPSGNSTGNTAPAINGTLANATTPAVNGTTLAVNATTTTTLPPCAKIKSNYTLSSEKLSWANARNKCRSLGMDLANVETDEENVCIKFIIDQQKKSGTFHWHALNKMGQYNHTQWLSGKALAYNDWKPGDPAAMGTEHCAGYENGGWVDAPCLDPYFYICETPQPVDMCDDYPPYVVSSDKLSYDAARAECQKRGMDLVFAETREENICIQRQLAMNGLAREEIWMGLSKVAGSNYSAWANGKPLTYTDWDTGNPASYGSENCAMFFNHHWHDNNCPNALKYICESTVVVDLCENMTHKYHIANDSMKTTWAKARLACKAMGMDLVSMETEEENTCVKKKLKDAGKISEVFWHSLNMYGARKFDQWVNGAPLTYTTGWAPGQPAQFPSEACGAFEYNGKWGDYPCEWEALFVCESDQRDPCTPGQFVPGSKKQTYDNAILECKKKGMQLATAESWAENRCLNLAVAEKGKQVEWVYFGLQRRGETNFTKWLNNAPLTYTDWAPGEPNFWDSEPCGMLWYGHWCNLGCDGAHNYVCEVAIIDDPCNGSTSNYTLSTDKLNWASARKACQAKGMDLANLETERENKCVKFKIELEQKTGTFHWHALNKMGTNNYTKWLSGKSLEYNDWKPGDPAAMGSEHCAGFEQNAWVDAPCLDPYSYVCETPKPLDACDEYPQYVVSTDKKTFDDARVECQKRNMDLISLESQEEYMCVQRQLAAAGLAREEIWMGLTKVAGGNYTTWLNGKPLTYTDWDTGNPGSFGSENCIMFFNHHWHDNQCGNSLKYICKSTVVVDLCENMTNRYYISNATEKTHWPKARIACKKMGMDLVSMETEEENTCIRKKLKDAGILAEVTWHSLNMYGAPKFNQWVNGEPLTFTSGWAPGQPAQFPGEACAAFEYLGKWGDYPCEWNANFVCESNQVDPCVEETPAENRCMMLAVAATGKQVEWVYMGLHKRGETNYTKWTNNAPLTYLDWYPGQPEPWDFEPCSIVWYGHWYTLSCGDPYHYICEAAVIDDPCRGLPSNYSVSTDALTWGPAREACRKLGMDLASIETVKEFNCIRDKIEFAGKASVMVYTGLNKMGMKNYTHWLTGAAVTLNGWDTNEPAALAAENCGVYKSGKWMDTSCFGVNNYVCETPAPKDICKKYNFSVSLDLKVYDDARFECVKKGMSIAVLETVEKNKCLQQYLSEMGYGTSITFIGLDKRRKSNWTVWDNGEAMTYDDFNPDAFDGFHDQHCVVAWYNHWYDAHCHLAYYYVCENVARHPCKDFAGNFTISTDAKTWTGAREECKKQGGDLAVLETPSENYCARYLIYIAGKKDARMWHGLNHLGTPLFTHWVNGEKLTYDAFVDGYNIKAYSGEMCAGFEGGAWGDVPCDYVELYMCESNPAPKEICKPNRFVIPPETQTYELAITKCQEQGMKLASMETLEENMCAQRHLLATGNFGSWTYFGLNKRGETNYTKWINGEPLTYVAWPPNEPGGFYSEHCAFLLYSQWWDISCGEWLRYLCEKNATAP